MPTIEQIRAARALIGWSQGELADHAGLSQTGIARIENGTNKPNSSTLAKITTAFDKFDVEFIGETGVKKRTGEVRMLKGQEGFNAFISDVYETVKEFGGEVCVSNVDERHFDKWLARDNFGYLEKMKALKEERDFCFKILVCEGDDFAIAKYAEYRWMKAKNFASVPFYVYGSKTAIILFGDDITVYVIDNKDIAEAQRKQFNICWKASESV